MILIVDDITANIVVLKKILSLHSLEVDTATSGEEALKKILKHDYSLIILDVQMPGMDGFEVAEILSDNNRTKDIPVLFLSAINKQKRFISRGYETGGVDYITKPIDPDLLILKVKTFLKLSEQKRELKATRDMLSKEVDIRKEAQDNLEIKVAERTQELLEKNEELELRNHELQQFSWAVSHDLKEPARKMELFVKIIKDRYLIDNDKAVNYAERTVNAAHRMSELITDLLDYSRLSSGAEMVEADLNSVVKEVLSDLDYIIENGKADIKVHQLPVIRCIPSQIRQVFQNLISNSLKFSKEGVKPEIEIKGGRIAEKSFSAEADTEGPFCRIDVTDNGIGFDEKYLDKIFVIFQGLNDRNVYEGTGIGLAIVKKIVEKHNGIITASSKPGEGSTFSVILSV